MPPRLQGLPLSPGVPAPAGLDLLSGLHACPVTLEGEGPGDPLGTDPMWGAVWGQACSAQGSIPPARPPPYVPLPKPKTACTLFLLG